MRRNYISPEFIETKVGGTLTHRLKSNYFNTNIMNIPEEIIIDNKTFIYYQRSNGEQIDYSTETFNTPLTISCEIIKNSNHNIINTSVDRMSISSSSNNWNIIIDYKNILLEYIFASVKNNRAFEGLTNQQTLNNSVDIFIENYIIDNILDKYTVRDIDFYVEYVSIKSGNYNKYKNIFDISTTQKNNKFRYNSNNENITINYTQEMTPEEYIFKYNFNIYFVRI